MYKLIVDDRSTGKVKEVKSEAIENCYRFYETLKEALLYTNREVTGVEVEPTNKTFTILIDYK